MRRARPVVIVFRFLAAGVAAFFARASALADQPVASLGVMEAWLASQRGTLLNATLVVAWGVAFIELIREFLDARHVARPTLQRLIDEFSKEHFPSTERHNRVTLFKETHGSVIRLWGLLRCWKLIFPSNFRVWRSIRWGERYVGVYVRARGARNRHSSISWRIGDMNTQCEGVAGQIWEDGAMVELSADFPVDHEKVKAARSMDAFPAGSPEMEYARETNIKTIESYQLIGNYSKHFCGTIIKRGGVQWGVLLIDSQEDNCRFPPGSVAQGKLAELALMLGRII